MIEYLLWGLAKGETMDYNVQKVKCVAAAHGYHSFRVSIFDGSPPDFKKTLNI